MSTISESVKSLGFDISQMVVVGSAVMEILGIRRAGDIDIVASPAILAKLEIDDTWQKHRHDDGSYLFSKGNFEIGNNWLKSGPKNNFHELVNQTFEVDGIKFIKPELVLAWKQIMGRVKDQKDIKLLENYLRAHQV